MSARSKLLSLVLRHAPERAGVTLDPQGWVEVEALLAGLAARGEGMSRAELEAIVRDSDKKRFTLSPDGERIRAAQGHSVGVELGLPDLAPPENVLFVCKLNPVVPAHARMAWSRASIGAMHVVGHQ